MMFLVCLIVYFEFAYGSFNELFTLLS
jgi:hypothetical protein